MEHSPQTLWDLNSVQFPRLLAEIYATVALTPKQWRHLKESTNLTREEIEELFERADAEWTVLKGVINADHT
jgi:hypothetical protein